MDGVDELVTEAYGVALRHEDDAVECVGDNEDWTVAGGKVERFDYLGSDFSVVVNAVDGSGGE